MQLEDYTTITYEDWMHDGGAELATLLFETKTVGEVVAEKLGGQYVLGTEEKAEAKVYVASLKARSQF